MSPTTSTPVLRISAVIAVTYLDSDPAGCTTLVASLSFISCSGLRCDCGELIIFSTLGSAFDPSHTIPLKTDACHRRRTSQIRQASHRCSSNRSHGCSHNSPAHETGTRERIFHVHFVARTDFAAKCARSNCLTPGVHSTFGSKTTAAEWILRFSASC